MPSQIPLSIWKYLGSLWGALSIVAILFPGATSILGDGVAPKSSNLTMYYTFVPSILAGFALLFLTSARDELADLVHARRWAVRSFLGSVCLLFAFLALGQIKLNVDQIEPATRSGNQVTVVERSRGLVSVSVTDTLGNRISALQRGDPWDVVNLALISGAFAMLTISFGALGINEYSRG